MSLRNLVPVGANQAVKVSTNPIVSNLYGIAYDAALAVVTVAVLPVPLFYVGGVPVDATGRVYIVDKAAATAPLQQGNGGLQFDATGRLVTVDTAAATAPVSFTDQLPFDASGALVTSP